MTTKQKTSKINAKKNNKQRTENALNSVIANKQWSQLYVLYAVRLSQVSKQAVYYRFINCTHRVISWKRRKYQRYRMMNLKWMLLPYVMGPVWKLLLCVFFFVAVEVLEFLNGWQIASVCERAPYEVSAYGMTNDDTKFISFPSFFRFDFFSL